MFNIFKKKNQKIENLKTEIEDLKKQIENLTNQFEQEKLQKMLDASNYIKSFCLNNDCKCKIPLIDETKHPFDFDNWNIPDKGKMREALDIVCRYADECIKMYIENGVSPYYHFDREQIPKKAILPHWVVFPEYSENSLFWRMGIGESYLFTFKLYFDTLSEEEQKQLLKTYPAPEWYRYWHLD